MKPILVQLTAQRKEHRQPEKGRQRAALQVDVVEGQHAEGEEEASPAMATPARLKLKVPAKIQAKIMKRRRSPLIHSSRD